MPITDAKWVRIRQAVSCQDCAAIPKVAGAGEVRGGVQTMHNGVKVAADCYNGEWMTELIRQLRGHHEPQEERVFHEMLRHVPAGSTMIELGAFWAYYALWFQHQIPDARTYMVELDPNNLRIGEENFGLNGASGQFFSYAVDSHSAPARPMHCNSDGLERNIPTICLDDFIEQQGIERVELLLSDIQGFEKPMLEGAARSIRRGKIRFALISTHHYSISGSPLTHQQCLEAVRNGGARVLAEHSVPESFSGDGLIAVSFDPRDRDLPEIPLTYNRSRNSLFGELEYDLARVTERCQDLEARLLEANQRWQRSFSGASERIARRIKCMLGR